VEPRIDALRREFERRFTGTPVVVRAPGRVNLIGEHTDYNDGFVLPVAINRDVLMAVAPRSDQRVRLYSLNFETVSEFDLNHIEKDPADAWGNYVRGVAQQLRAEGLALSGMEGVVEGNVPIASGLSSSAALEVASAVAFQAVSGFEMDRVRMALLCQRAERAFMGVQVGIMDQFISCLGKAGHALFVDCRSLEYETVPLHAAGHVFMVADSRRSRELAASEYNVRRAQCEQAVAGLQESLPEIRALRDVSPAEFLRHSAGLDLVPARRARHVVHEDARVMEAIQCLRAGQLVEFGRLMNESHESLRFDYEVSSRELDVLVGAARSVEGCLGSRLTGAGFGGCTVSLVRAEAVPEFERRVTREYRERTGREAAIYVCTAEEGASIVDGVS
jgi:galactokinase